MPTALRRVLLTVERKIWRLGEVRPQMWVQLRSDILHTTLKRSPTMPENGWERLREQAPHPLCSLATGPHNSQCWLPFKVWGFVSCLSLCTAWGTANKSHSLMTGTEPKMQSDVSPLLQAVCHSPVSVRLFGKRSRRNEKQEHTDEPNLQSVEATRI